MHTLRPKNKYAWIKNLDQDGKVGLLYTAPSATNQYRLAKLLAFDTDCPEAQGYEVGQTVLYDTIGAVEHRIGNAMYTTVKILNVVSIVEEKPAAQRDTIPGVDPNKVVG